MSDFFDIPEAIPTIDLSAPPAWMPEAMIEDLKGHPGTVEFRFTKGERKTYRHEAYMRVSEWSGRYRNITKGPIQGPWQNALTHYLVGIMDAMDHPAVRESALMKGPQSGGTESAFNWIGKKADCEPDDIIACFCDETTAKENSSDRIQPMFKTTPRLARHLTGRADDESGLKLALSHMTIYLGWASSASRLANKPIRYAFADEIDKPGWGIPQAERKKKKGSLDSKETSPLNLLRKRLTTFRRLGLSKFWKISTPTVETGNIYQEFLAADVRFDYWVTCPDCSRHQIMVFEQIQWPGRSDTDPSVVENDRLARYHCAHCTSQWDDDKRDDAVRGGEWRSRPAEDSNQTPLELFRYLDTFRPANIAFHLPSWVSYFVSMSEAAASFLRGLKNIDDRKDFFNAHAAMPYIPKRREQKADVIKALKDDRPEGVVPGGGQVAALLFGADTQGEGDGWWYEIRAFGYGIIGDSWQVRAGFVETFEALEKVLWEHEYKDVDGNVYQVQFGLIDAMGHYTSEVYDWCIKHRGKVLPIKGEQRMSSPFAFTNLEFYPGGKKPLPGGLQLIRLDTNYYKNRLYSRLQSTITDPGAWRYSSATTDHWADMMVAEYIDEATGLWDCPEGVDNHGFDCSVYVPTAYDYLGVKHWAKPDRRGEVKTTPQRDEDSKKLGRKKPSWFNRR